MLQAIAVLTPLYVAGFWAIVFLSGWSKKNNAKFFLGFFMTIAFLLYLGHSLFFYEVFDQYLYYDPIYIFASLMVYPVYYQYIRLLTVDRRFKKHYLLHYIPAAFTGLLALIVNREFRQLAESNLSAYFAETYRFSLDFAGDYFWGRFVYMLNRMLYLIQIIVYFFWGYILIKQHERRIQEFYSSHQGRDIRWSSYIFYSFVVVAVFSILFNIIGKTTFLNNDKLLLIPSMLFSFLLFVLGYLGNGQNQVVCEIKGEEDSQHTSDHHSRIDRVEMKRKIDQLFADQKVYLNHDLKIWDLSSMLGTNRTYVSQFINAEFGMNFSMFVNSYRVAEAKVLLRRNDGDVYSLDVIGERCGFGSYSNFIRVFRSMEKITPGQYRDQQ